MARVSLKGSEHELVRALDLLRDQAGWTVRELAEEVGLPLETLRGVIYAKNRPGPRVLYRLLAYVDKMHADLGLRTPTIVGAIQAQILEVWGDHLPRLLDRFWDRVRWDFRSVADLVKFLRIAPDEWTSFTRGADPSPSLLQAVASAYSEEARHVSQEDPEDAKLCEATAEFARLLIRILSGLG